MYRFENKAKYLRALKEAGEGASIEQVVALYDKFGGRLKVEDNKGQAEVVETGTYWDFNKDEAKPIKKAVKKTTKKEVRKKTNKKKK